MDNAKLFHSRIVSSNNLFQITLADLLKKLSIRHCNVANVNDAGIALSNILVVQCPTKRLKNQLKIKDWEKGKVYQGLNNLNFLPKLEIDLMDVPLLYKLLTKIKAFPTCDKMQQNICQYRLATNNFCCAQCSHLCNFCNQEECPPNCQNKINNVWNHPCHCGKTKSECIEANCIYCLNKASDLQCGIYNLSRGVDISKKTRDVSFHLTLMDCKGFVEQGTALSGFRYFHTKEQLFQLISTSFCSIVNFAANRSHFEGNAITFEERRANIHSMNLILFGEERDIVQDLVKNLSNQSIFFTEHIRRLQSEVSALREVEEYNVAQLLLQRYSEEECQLTLKGIKVTGISKVKIRQHSHGNIQTVDPDDYNFVYDPIAKLSVINIFHQIKEGSKYDYELVIQDEQKRKWKASAAQLDPGDDNLLKIEMLNGSKMYMSPHAYVISRHPMRLEEKKACEMTSSFTSVGVTRVIIAECKEEKSKQWDRSANIKVTHLKDDVYQLNVTILPRGNYDFRVLVKTTAGKYRLYELETITVLEEKGFQHASSYQKTLLLTHPIGDKEDASETLKTLPRHGEVGQNGFQVSVQLPGLGETTKDIDIMESFIVQNFLHQPVICFPPFYMMPADSSHVKIAKLLYGHLEILERKRFIILPKVNFTENLKTLGFTDNQISNLFANEFGRVWLSTFATVVFDIDTRMVLLITLSENGESLQEAHIRSDSIVKAFLTISQHSFGQVPIAVVGIVACLESGRETTNDFCEDCCQHILTKDEIEIPEAFKNWFRDLSNNIRKNFQSHLSQPTEENPDESPLLRIANRMMLLISISDCSLPFRPVGSDEQKIKKLLLTPQQIHAVYDDQHKKKVIKGNYGSGKTIVIKKKLQLLNNDEPKEDVIYYISWDPYSLINVEIYKEIEKENQQSKKSLQQDRVICKNVCQLSEEARSRTVFSLSQCLQNISDVHSKQTAHVLIDEYDEEELTKEEETSISNILQTSATFKNAHIVVSVQSVVKERKRYFSKSSKPSVSMYGCWEGCGLNICMLPHTMRFTNKINDVVNNFQHAVAKKPNIYFASVAQKTDSSNRTVLSDKNTEVVSTALSSGGKLPSAINHNNSSTETFKIQQQGHVKLRPQQNIDTLAKHAGINQGDARLETTFKFMSCVSGHNIPGSAPKLIRVDISLGINVELLKCFMKSFCFSDHKKALLVCNDLPLMRALVEVFQTIGVQIIQYFDNLVENIPPSFKTQKSVYEELISVEEKTLVLLTDSRGCRGLEYKNVICIIDEREDIERHLVIENLCRATSNLHLISFQGVPQETDTSRIVEFLTTNNYVEDVTGNCMKLCSETINYIKIDNKKQEHKEHQLNEKVQELLFSELTEEDKQKNWTFEDLDTLIRNQNDTKVVQLISINPSRIQLRGDIGGYGVNNNLLHSASWHDSNVDFVQHLINAGCSLKKNNTYAFMPIHVAAMNDRVGIVKVMLDNDPSLINERSDDNLTSLHIATRINLMGVVEVLLQQPNIDVNIKDEDGKMADEYIRTNDEIKGIIRQHRENNSL